MLNRREFLSLIGLTAAAPCVLSAAVQTGKKASKPTTVTLTISGMT